MLHDENTHLTALLDTAKDHFNKGHYKLAEPLLAQLQNEAFPKPDINYMLAAIAFDRGQLKKAIQLFKQSLEIDPNFTDSAVGLSIILNDLGKYEEAKKIFEDAYTVMKSRQRDGESASNRSKPNSRLSADPIPEKSLNQKLADKHAELGALYLANDMYQEAIDEYKKANKLAPDSTDYNLKLVEAYSQGGEKDKARFELDKMQVRGGERPEIDSWRRRLDELNF